MKYNDLYIHGVLRNFQDLKVHYGLTNLAFYKFLQLRHYTEKTITKKNLDKTNSGIYERIWVEKFSKIFLIKTSHVGGPVVKKRQIIIMCSSSPIASKLLETN